MEDLSRQNLFVLFKAIEIADFAAKNCKITISANSCIYPLHYCDEISTDQVRLYKFERNRHSFFELSLPIRRM